MLVACRPCSLLSTRTFLINPLFRPKTRTSSPPKLPSCPGVFVGRVTPATSTHPPPRCAPTTTDYTACRMGKLFKTERQRLLRLLWSSGQASTVFLSPLDAATVARECMYGVSQRSMTGLPRISRWVSALLYPALASCQPGLQSSPLLNMGCSAVVMVDSVWFFNLRLETGGWTPYSTLVCKRRD